MLFIDPRINQHMPLMQVRALMKPAGDSGLTSCRRRKIRCDRTRPRCNRCRGALSRWTQTTMLFGSPLTAILVGSETGSVVSSARPPGSLTDSVHHGRAIRGDDAGTPLCEPMAIEHPEHRPLGHRRAQRFRSALVTKFSLRDSCFEWDREREGKTD